MNKQGMGLWIVVIALLILDIGVHCVRAQDDSSKVVKTQDLQIVDSSGTVVGDFSADKGSNPMLTLYNENGDGLVGLQADEDGERLLLGKEGGPGSAFFRVDKDGTGYVVFLDKKKTPRAALRYSADDDSSSLALVNKDANAGVIAISDKNGNSVNACDSAGVVRAGVVTKDDKPSFDLYDKDAKVAWEQNSDGNNDPSR
jgi:hypothetical protein